jgi:hypothetical protein
MSRNLGLGDPERVVNLKTSSAKERSKKAMDDIIPNRRLSPSDHSRDR